MQEIFTMAKKPIDLSQNTIQTRLLTWFLGEHVGEDVFGNQYYQEKLLFAKYNRAPRRWVLYNGIPDASKVPAEWFGWLHFTHEHPLQSREKHTWEKPHQPNLTRTGTSYRPKGHILNRGLANGLAKRYEAWRPPVTK